VHRGGLVGGEGFSIDASRSRQTRTGRSGCLAISATGINFYSGELTAKRLELLRELVPAATRVAVLVNPANATTTETTLRDVAAPARAMGLQIQVLNVQHQPRD
jgi:hypothetical protein